MGETILKMTGINKRFAGIKALDEACLDLNRGEVRALIGENGAGKSTLMKVLLGVHKPDGGVIELDGQEAHFNEPKDALNAGISMIHQEISLIPTADVAENIWLGREDQFIEGGLFINAAKRRKATKELLDRIGIKLDPQVKVGTLSIAMMQMVELARAVSCQSRIIIMDEPTSALTDQEVEILFSVVRDLSRQGVSVIFISHKIEEIFQICETVTILRDGKTIGTRKIDESLTRNELVSMIVGRDLDNAYQKKEVPIGDVVLEVQNLCRENVFEDVSFTIRAGEIVGFSGLLGAGRSEIARAIFGIDKLSSGRILVNGKEVHNKNPRQAIHNGFGMVTEDRLRMGCIHKLSVKHNATLANLFRFGRGAFVDRNQEQKKFLEIANKMSIKYADENDTINSLSGGNQQKVVLARWLMTNPKILILDEPTRGIDVGSKSEIYKLTNELAGMGLAIMFISSEMPEILSLCDRTFVVRNGRLTYECPRSEMTQEILGKHAFGL